MLNKALRSKGASIAISSVMIMQTIAFMSAGVSADTADEKIENFVKRCYTVTLGREGDEEGIAYWKDQLAYGNMVGSVVVRNFMGSEEYTSKGSTNEGYINDLYQIFMGRQAESEGAVYWNQQLENGVTRDAVFAGFANSEEFDTLCKEAGITAGYFTAEYDINKVNGVNLFVERMYKTCLGRTGDQGGQAYWTQGLLNGSLTGIACAANFVQSDEYKNLNLSAEDYVKNLYTAFMGREPDQAGSSFWAGAINDGSYSREDVFNGFANSAEFASICVTYGIVSGSDTAPIEDQDVSQPQYRLTGMTKTYSDGRKEVMEVTYEKDGSQKNVTTEYGTDGKTVVDTYTEISKENTFIYIDKDGVKDVYNYDDNSMTSYKADGSVDKERSYTTTEKTEGDKDIEIHTNLNGKVIETSVSEPVQDGYKTIYYDADGNVEICFWSTRTYNEDKNAVTTEYNADGTVAGYYIAELRKSDNAWITTFYDGKGNVTEKHIQTGDYHQKTEIYDGKGNLIGDSLVEYLTESGPTSKSTEHDYQTNITTITEYFYEKTDNNS